LMGSGVGVTAAYASNRHSEVSSWQHRQHIMAQHTASSSSRTAAVSSVFGCCCCLD
jgi:hypothetical protein